MQTFNYCRSLILLLKFIYIVVVTSCGLLCVNQHSLAAFWQHQYHSMPFWSVYNNELWLVIGRFPQALKAAENSFIMTLTNANDHSFSEADITAFSLKTTLVKESELVLHKEENINFTDKLENEPKHFIFAPLFSNNSKMNFPLIANQNIIVDTSVRHYQRDFLLPMLLAHHQRNLYYSGLLPANTLNELDNNGEKRYDKPNPIVLNTQKKVLFIGDSMMQGVAPHVIGWLLKQHKIASINLSLQSTGLTYPKFFNWPKKLAETFNKNKDIQLLVVFLGANDPWDMSSSSMKIKHFLKFKSEQWEQEYRSRIQLILSQAKHAGVPVIWLELPVMRNTKLATGVAYLNTLYESEIAKANQHYISTNRVLNNQNKKYTDRVIRNGKHVKVRTNDGIHLTATGQKMIAEQITSILTINN